MSLLIIVVVGFDGTLHRAASSAEVFIVRQLSAEDLIIRHARHPGHCIGKRQVHIVNFSRQGVNGLTLAGLSFTFNAPIDAAHRHDVVLHCLVFRPLFQSLDIVFMVPLC